MATKIPKLENSQAVGFHISAGYADEFITEAQYILDEKQTEESGSQVSIQETINNLVEAQQSQEWATKQDIGDLFVECDEVIDYSEAETEEETNEEQIETT